ncbi:hypothetical protein [Paractinoplanes toevensis]|uniref:Lipoprotein n=1 Tax=Paractinoplanes toevensis TaxID=571911 RepID=A0A919W629_9ACTN|nr:hypothetical protein [Actinoplanes toevensis]GIM93920.1 hypothetical protein Ato02nite_057130 [Actinoplanes toevensis]
MGRIPGWTAITLAFVLVVGAGGCYSDEAAAPPVCDSFAAVQNTVDHIREVNVSENGLSQLRPYLTQLREQLTQLYTDARAQFAPQADRLKAAVDQLEAALRTARDDPSALNLAAVRTTVTAVRAGGQDLRAAMAQTC